MLKVAAMAAALFLSVAASAQTNLGHVEFPTSGSPQAQSHFIQGVLLLHNFEYDDAREEFQAASKLQPDFAMAYWGEALTHTYTLWNGQDLTAARAVLSKLAPTADGRLAKAPTDREKDYLRALEALYGPGEKPARDRAYADALGRMTKNYPNDLEAASFYALALLGTCEKGRDYATYMRAAGVAEEVFAKNPQHPGAIHYLIHAYDDPVHAPLGLRPARVYAKVAGSASHAQHMPSHIFFALGMWDDAIAANILSVQVADDRTKSKSLGPDHRNYHALTWLHYAYLQEGRLEEAQKLTADIERTGYTQVLPRMRSTFALETGKWDDWLIGSVTPKLPAFGAISILSATGLTALRTGKIDQARRAYELASERLKANPQQPTEPVHHGGATMVSTEPASVRQASEVMVQQLRAELLIRDKKDEGLKLLAEAARQEDAISFEFGPPLPVKPSHELYGEELLRVGRPKEAVEEFQRALLRAPNRTLSLRGLVRAQEACGDVAASKDTAAVLKSFWHGEATESN
jgi:tetratricopeptide (TPR) repeat protein